MRRGVLCALYWSSSLSSLLLFSWLILATTTANAQSSDCGMTIEVFDTRDDCSNGLPALATATLFGDNECRSLSTRGSTGSTLLPGIHRATCNGSDQVTFVQSDCASLDACNNAADDVCPSSQTFGHVYARLSPPTFQLAATGQRFCYRGFFTNSNGVTITAAWSISGTCNVDCRDNTNTVPPTIPLTPPPTRLPTLSPTRLPTARPSLPPTARPSQTPVSNPTPRPTRAPSAPVTVPTTESPTSRPVRESPTIPTVPTAVPGDGGPPTTSNSSNSDNNNNNNNIGMIAGVAAASVLVLAGTVLYYIRRRSVKRSNNNNKNMETTNDDGSSHERHHHKSSSLPVIIHRAQRQKQEHTASSSDKDFVPPPLPKQQQQQQQQQRWTNEIWINADDADDISTLEGGTIAGSRLHDDPTASVGDVRYDYLHNRVPEEDDATQTTLSKLSSKMSHLGSILDVDDDTVFEALFAKDILETVADNNAKITPYVIQATPGVLLGMVVETSGGIPSVRKIRRDSAFAKRVKVGDVLIAVNNQDVTGMTATQVSECILRQQNAHRTLVLVRPDKKLQFGHNQANV